jgi:hypothetical protein
LGAIRQHLAQLRSELRAAELVRLRELDLKNHPRYSDPRRLVAHAFQVCSAGGEDGILREIFRRIQPAGRVFAEVGVGDGAENNTALLLALGWKGFWVDGDKAFLGKIRKRKDLHGGCLKGVAAYVNRENIAQVFTELGVPTEFDLLSLDVDQNTFYLWEGLRNFRPRVVVVEYNATIPPDIVWKVNYDPERTWDGSHNFGASLKAFEQLGRELGYSLVGCEFVGANAFFVRNDLIVPNLFCEPFTAENHYEPPRYALAHRAGHPPAVLDRPVSG